MPTTALALSADKKILLIVYASQTGRTARLAQAVADGARAQQESGVQVHCCQAPDATLDALLTAHALVLATPENFGYMAGLLKDFLDRTYLPAQGRCQGLPYAIVVSAGNDGRGAIAAIERIAIGYGWRSHTPAMTGVWRCRPGGQTAAPLPAAAGCRCGDTNTADARPMFHPAAPPPAPAPPDTAVMPPWA